MDEAVARPFRAQTPFHFGDLTLDWITDPQAWIAFVTLTILEIVLGIDNIVFISILTRRLPPEQQALGRKIGLALALIGRIVLLISISWVIGLTADLFTVFNLGISGRDLVLISGGLFLLYKATIEIHHSVEGKEEEHEKGGRASFKSVLFQILLLDIVFSLDSVITAVGMADDLGVMVCAVVVAVGFMMYSASAVADFIQRHPTVKMLALAFLLMVGMSLVADGISLSINHNYVYFAMGFSMFVELMNLKMKAKMKEKKAA
jgi:predicted tellurium resistance membrane protein TerC